MQWRSQSAHLFALTDVVLLIAALVGFTDDFFNRHLSNSDAWIAATAVLLDAPLLTHNRKDYESLESLQIISDSSKNEKER